MKRFTSSPIPIVLLIGLTALLTLFGGSTLARQPVDAPAIAQSTIYNPATFARTFTHHTADVNGTQLHYVMGGKGEPIVLLHGWPKTWYKWRKVMPALAARYTVIVPDLPGLGDSSPSTTGYDKRAIAQTIYQLVNQSDTPSEAGGLMSVTASKAGVLAGDILTMG